MAGAADPVRAPVPLPASPTAQQFIDADNTSVGNLHCSLKKAHALLSARSGLCDANHGRAAYLDSVLTPYNDFLLRMQTSRCPVQYVLAVLTISCAWVDASSY